MYVYMYRVQTRRLLLLTLVLLKCFCCFVLWMYSICLLDKRYKKAAARGWAGWKKKNIQLFKNLLINKVFWEKVVFYSHLQEGKSVDVSISFFTLTYIDPTCLWLVCRPCFNSIKVRKLHWHALIGALKFFLYQISPYTVFP